MMRSRRLAATSAVLLVALCGCSVSSGSAAQPTTVEASAPTTAQWCVAYSSLTKVLANAGTDVAGATSALAALERFEVLWGIADDLGIADAAEVAANQRAVVDYRAMMTLLQAGSAPDSEEVLAARSQLTSDTEADRAVLTSAAAKVVALCGAPKGNATASTGATTG